MLESFMNWNIIPLLEYVARWQAHAIAGTGRRSDGCRIAPTRGDRMNRHTAIAAGIAALGVACAPAHAQSGDTITLKVADSFPAGHFIPKGSTIPFMEAITKRSGGKVKFEYYPAQQLGKAADLLNLTQSGVTEIGYVGMSYVSDKMPLSAVAQLPGSFSTACEGTLAYWKLAQSDTLGKNEFGANKVRPLWVVVLEPYQFYMVSRPVRTTDDLKGMKLRSTGGAMDLFARKIGAVPVRMAAPEVRESLSRGTLDGLIFPNESVLAYDLQTLVKHATRGGNFGSFVAAYVISDAVWRKLPKATQDAMTEVGDAVTKSMCKEIDANVEKAQGQLAAAGVKFHTLTPAELKPFEDVSDEVAKDWADGLDKRGKPGTRTLNEFRAALKEVRR
jgi:TRAP-type C4-dicarboxylate transport system substrate-binding protein